MKLFKEIELFVNLLLIGAFTISIVVTKKMDVLFLAYFTIGAVQVFGVLIHLLNKWFTNQNSKRRVYNWIVLLLLILLPTGLPALAILLYTAPILALYYTYICWRELRALQLKEFVHLK